MEARGKARQDRSMLGRRSPRKDNMQAGARRSGAGLLTPLAIAVSAGAYVAVRAHEQPHLYAQGSGLPDTDGDGLVDVLEKVLGTSVTTADTDGDLYSDAEELARKSSPIYAQFTPESEQISVGMCAFATSSVVHLVIAAYIPDGNFQTMGIQLGAAVSNRLLEMPPSLLAGASTD